MTAQIQQRTPATLASGDPPVVHSRSQIAPLRAVRSPTTPAATPRAVHVPSRSGTSSQPCTRRQRSPPRTRPRGACAASSAIGFSTTTCLPARMAASAAVARHHEGWQSGRRRRRPQPAGRPRSRTLHIWRQGRPRSGPRPRPDRRRLRGAANPQRSTALASARPWYPQPTTPTLSTACVLIGPPPRSEANLAGSPPEPSQYAVCTQWLPDIGLWLGSQPRAATSAVDRRR